GGVVERGGVGRVDSEAARCLEVDVGCRLSAGDLLGRDGCLEVLRDAHEVEREVDQLAVRRGGDGEGPASGEALDCRLGAGCHREVPALALLQPLYPLPASL